MLLGDMGRWPYLFALSFYLILMLRHTGSTVFSTMSAVVAAIAGLALADLALWDLLASTHICGVFPHASLVECFAFLWVLVAPAWRLDGVTFGITARVFVYQLYRCPELFFGSAASPKDAPIKRAKS